MAAVRRGHSPLKVDLSAAAPTDLPPISALFLIYFDIKAGYTIGWKRAVPGLELEGVVEYKSLPSGLHTVKEDLIYFVHENHAGLSAFINAPADEESRNARMIAVGIMVPLSYGRLGRSWKHAEKLKEMASALIVDESKTEILEDFWKEHKSEDPTPKETDSVLDSPSSILYAPVRNNSRGQGRHRSASDGAALLPPGQTLSAHHPAWSLPALLEAFGPLIFPIHRAALLRKRILIISHAPVEETCNFVYNISILSNIPLAVNELLAPTAPPQRLRPLFSIGVHDIPLLEEDLKASKAPTDASEPSDEREENGNGWIACTTDSILAMKSALYDVLITMPPAYSSSATDKVWPKVESPQGIEMKATQRDLRRYRALRWGLSRHTSPPSSPEPRHSSSGTRDDPMLDIPETDGIVEPVSWSALAYSGFMWWASAGEGQRLDIESESENDSDLLSGLTLSHTPGGGTSTTRTSAAQETAIIAYFHRLSGQFLTTISDIVDATDSDDDAGNHEEDDEDEDQEEGEALIGAQHGPAVYVTSNDVARMGLDVWSAGDHAFVEDLAHLYFGRRAQVEGKNIDVCGVRIC
ncbi:hypothetical protein PVAG01_02715 [Phlyctema vagabunda]|uniref:DUF4484 domain-containing protein n=1 Tax=Phlyctema vagabunda TaxID=108571 RepID=A0ABR4PRC5_9HELO